LYYNPHSSSTPRGGAASRGVESLSDDRLLIADADTDRHACDLYIPDVPAKAAGTGTGACAGTGASSRGVESLSEDRLLIAAADNDRCACDLDGGAASPPLSPYIEPCCGCATTPREDADRAAAARAVIGSAGEARAITFRAVTARVVADGPAEAVFTGGTRGFVSVTRPAPSLLPPACSSAVSVSKSEGERFRSTQLASLSESDCLHRTEERCFTDTDRDASVGIGGAGSMCGGVIASVAGTVSWRAIEATAASCSTADIGHLLKGN